MASLGSPPPHFGTIRCRTCAPIMPAPDIRISSRISHVFLNSVHDIVINKIGRACAGEYRSPLKKKKGAARWEPKKKYSLSRRAHASSASSSLHAGLRAPTTRLIKCEPGPSSPPDAEELVWLPLDALPSDVHVIRSCHALSVVGTNTTTTPDSLHSLEDDAVEFPDAALASPPS